MMTHLDLFLGKDNFIFRNNKTPKLRDCYNYITSLQVFHTSVSW